MNSSPGLLSRGTKIKVGVHTLFIDRYLSAGGYAHVYICTSQLPIYNAYSHVLKRVAVASLASLQEVGNEVEMMKLVRNSPHIVNLIDAAAYKLPQGGHEVFILMELCPGGGLIDVMNQHLKTRLSEQQILDVFVGVSDALAHMHSLRILHRDLKIENILKSSGSVYKLCDFGSATLLPVHPQQLSSVDDIKRLEEEINRVTTLQYRSPEMINLPQSRYIDEKSDIWALGVLLYKLCYYTTPFENGQGGVDSLAILHAQYTIPTSPLYSSTLNTLISSMLRQVPRERPAAVDILRRVHQMRGTLHLFHPPQPKQPKQPSPIPVKGKSRPLPTPPQQPAIYKQNLLSPSDTPPLRRGRVKSGESGDHRTGGAVGGVQASHSDTPSQPLQPLKTIQTTSTTSAKTPTPTPHTSKSLPNKLNQGNQRQSPASTRNPPTMPANTAVDTPTATSTTSSTPTITPTNDVNINDDPESRFPDLEAFGDQFDTLSRTTVRVDGVKDAQSPYTPDSPDSPDELVIEEILPRHLRVPRQLSSSSPGSGKSVQMEDLMDVTGAGSGSGREKWKVESDQHDIYEHKNGALPPHLSNKVEVRSPSPLIPSEHMQDLQSVQNLNVPDARGKDEEEIGGRIDSNSNTLSDTHPRPHSHSHSLSSSDDDAEDIEYPLSRNYAISSTTNEKNLEEEEQEKQVVKEKEEKQKNEEEKKPQELRQEVDSTVQAPSTELGQTPSNPPSSQRPPSPLVSGVGEQHELDKFSTSATPHTTHKTSTLPHSSPPPSKKKSNLQILIEKDAERTKAQSERDVHDVLDKGYDKNAYPLISPVKEEGVRSTESAQAVQSAQKALLDSDPSMHSVQPENTWQRDRERKGERDSDRDRGQKAVHTGMLVDIYPDPDSGGTGTQTNTQTSTVTADTSTSQLIDVDVDYPSKSQSQQSQQSRVSSQADAKPSVKPKPKLTSTKSSESSSRKENDNEEQTHSLSQNSNTTANTTQNSGRRHILHSRPRTHARAASMVDRYETMTMDVQEMEVKGDKAPLSHVKPKPKPESMAGQKTSKAPATLTTPATPIIPKSPEKQHISPKRIPNKHSNARPVSMYADASPSQKSSDEKDEGRFPGVAARIEQWNKVEARKRLGRWTQLTAHKTAHTDMPDKAKADNKKKQQKTEKSKTPKVDNTFGMKNKKGGKGQREVTRISQEQSQSGKSKVASDKERQQNIETQQKRLAEKKAAEEAKLLAGAQPPQRIPFGVDPKTIVCQYFKAGYCEKGKKCKFAHSDGKPKVEKKDIYSDARDDESTPQDTMDKWDDEKLRQVVLSKHGNPKSTTEIVCKFFIQAIEDNKYGWFWTCPNEDPDTKKECHYRHALPQGFVLKSQLKREKEENANKTKEITIEAFLETERHKLGTNLTPVTKENFDKWKRDRVNKKEAETEAVKKVKEASHSAGRQVGMSGRDLFTYNADWFEDESDEEEDEWDLTAYRKQKQEEDEADQQAMLEKWNKAFAATA
ncbi:hypothetical protein E3P91_04092 [Wallemia ichthyophaga]|nr:hypothetical protein E3P91_04092 [Wallemia ichthyophaga]